MLVVGVVDPLILVVVLDLVAVELVDLVIMGVVVEPLELMELLEQAEEEAAAVLVQLQTLEDVVVMALSSSLILLDKYQKN
jgi:hypothetical protein